MYQMYNTYNKIRGRMREMGVDRKWIRQKVGICEGAFSQKMNAKSSFSLDEAYAILDALRIPREKIYEYFPPDGKPHIDDVA